MKIQHIALYVYNLEQMKEFYQKYFGGIASSRYHNPATGLQTYFLEFAGETRLELMTRPDLVANEKVLLQTGWTHLAFSLGTKEAVDAVAARLQRDGIPLVSGPRVTGDGYYEACFLDPEGNQVEITE